MRLFQPVQALMGLYSNLTTVQVSLSRVYELLDARPDVVEAADPIRLASVQGAIEFSGVSVDLGRGQILQSISFSVGSGETLALVGPSGSGKSTIADLLVRLIDPDVGVVRLDGVDLKRVSLEDLRRHVVLVDQEPALLHASIEENIRYVRPDAPETEVQQAIFAAGVDEILARLPDGIRTVVGERGLRYRPESASVWPRAGCSQIRRCWCWTDPPALDPVSGARCWRISARDARPHDGSDHPSSFAGVRRTASSCSATAASSSKDSRRNYGRAEAASPHSLPRDEHRIG